MRMDVRGLMKGNEARALNALAVMRDQKIVFFGVREVLNNTALSADAALAKIREYYEAFNESHPE